MLARYNHKTFANAIHLSVCRCVHLLLDVYPIEFYAVIECRLRQGGSSQLNHRTTGYRPMRLAVDSSLGPRAEAHVCLRVGTGPVCDVKNTV